MISSGIEWLQIRVKRTLSDRDFYSSVNSCLRLASARRTRIWVNDRTDIATLLPVHGLHLGQQDLSPDLARTIVGNSKWIGQSTHNEEQIRVADQDPAVDVVAVGPIYSTTSKADSDPVLGLEILRCARELTDKPLVAIGGITTNTIGDVIDAGATSVALLGALCRGDIEENCKRALAAAAGGRT
jgi:thiamine-phosphate pyrophosphorylase